MLADKDQQKQTAQIDRRNKLHKYKHKHKTEPITKQNKTNTVEGNAANGVDEDDAAMCITNLTNQSIYYFTSRHPNNISMNVSS